MRLGNKFLSSLLAYQSFNLSSFPFNRPNFFDGWPLSFPHTLSLLWLPRDRAKWRDGNISSSLGTGRNVYVPRRRIITPPLTLPFLISPFLASFCSPRVVAWFRRIRILPIEMDALSLMLDKIRFVVSICSSYSSRAIVCSDFLTVMKNKIARLLDKNTW